MKKGFTILELLVASLLLGMLVTILTMVFNQSSIAWRTGVAGVADLDDVRDNMAEVREEADNAFVWGKELYRITGLWDETGVFLDRACDAPGSMADRERYHANFFRKDLKSKLTSSSARLWAREQNMLSVGRDESDFNMKNYTVNVMSAGPDHKFGNYDDIWSWPDDFD